MSFPDQLRLTRRPAKFFRTSWGNLTLLGKILASLVIGGVALGALILLIGLVFVGHLLSGLVIGLLVAMATGGAVLLQPMQGFAISLLASMIALLFLPVRARR